MPRPLAPVSSARRRTWYGVGGALASILAATAAPAPAAAADETTPEVDTSSAIGQYYAAHQEQLGQPLSPEDDEGTWSEQLFTGGRVVDSETAGTHLIKLGYDKVLQAAGGVEALGVPEDEDLGQDGVYRQNFVDPDRDSLARPYASDHYVLEWSKSLEAVKTFEVSGAENAFYALNGSTDGDLGVPVADAVSQAGGTVQTFQHGDIATPENREPHIVADGPVREAWTAAGQAEGSWGFPIREARTQDDGTTVQYFDHVVATTSADGTVTTSSYQEDHVYEYDQFVVADEAGMGEPSPDGTGLRSGDGAPDYQHEDFQYGTLVLNGNGWTALSAPVAEAYNNEDFPARPARLGQAKGFTLDSEHGLVTHFEHGSLYYDQDTKTVVETDD